MRPNLRWTALLLSALLLGCGDGSPGPLPEEETVALSEIPEGVLKVAKERLPDVEFERAWLVKEEGGELAYEIRGRNNQGKTREVKVSASGKVLEEE